jgi:biopolymer transport protein ExbB/TolQ
LLCSSCASSSPFYRRYLQEEEDLRLLGKEREDQLFSRLRSTRLNEYVGLVRTNLHERRAIEKKERRQAEIEKIKEQKQKLMEARLKALSGE